MSFKKKKKKLKKEQKGRKKGGVQNGVRKGVRMGGSTRGPNGDPAGGPDWRGGPHFALTCLGIRLTLMVSIAFGPFCDLYWSQTSS